MLTWWNILGTGYKVWTNFRGWTFTILLAKDNTVISLFNSIQFNSFLLWKCMYSVSSYADSTPSPLRANVYLTLFHSFLSWATYKKICFVEIGQNRLSASYFFLFLESKLPKGRMVSVFIWWLPGNVYRPSPFLVPGTYCCIFEIRNSVF